MAKREKVNKTFCGVAAFYSAEPTAGLPFFRRAVEIDPEFAIAYAFISCGCTVLPDLAARNIRKAYALRENVSEQEKFSQIRLITRLKRGI